MTYTPAPAQRILPSRSIRREVAVQFGAVIIVAILAQISIPMWPVPVTGQTLGVVALGGLLGFRRGALAMLLYVGVGVLGVPVFAGFSAGFPPYTAGYLIGFPIAAGTAGLLAEHGFTRTFPRAVMTMTLATIPIFVVGVAWLALSYEGNALQTGFYPFLPGAVVKITIAAAITARSGRRAA